MRAQARDHRSDKQFSSWKFKLIGNHTQRLLLQHIIFNLVSDDSNRKWNLERLFWKCSAYVSVRVENISMRCSQMVVAKQYLTHCLVAFADVCCILLRTKPHFDIEYERQTCAYYFRSQLSLIPMKYFIISRALSVLPFPFEKWMQSRLQESENSRAVENFFSKAKCSRRTTDERGNKWLCYYVRLFYYDYYWECATQQTLS